MARAHVQPQRKLAVILMADVVGYSRLTSLDEADTIDRFRRYLTDDIRPAIRRCKGRLVKTLGDGLLVEFDSPVNAVHCALSIQEGAAKRNRALGPDKQMLFRIGINLADVLVDGDDVLGDGVNIAARLQAIAEPGGIIVSEAVAQYVRGKAPGQLEDLGQRTLKNIPQPVRVFRLRQSAAPSQSVPRQADTKLSIAILPFVNMSGEADQQYFSDGITEDIITELSRFRTLAVVSRNSSFVYRDKAVDVKQIADELGVQFVVEGSVRRIGDRVRITVQLLSGETRQHVWAEKYDVNLVEIFTVQDDVTRRVVGTLFPRIETEELNLARKRPTEIVRAYDCYLRGKALFFAAPDAASRTEARRFFEQAFTLDPNFARAYCYAAAVDNNLAMYAAGNAAVLKARDVARQLAQKAVSLDDSDPTTHISMAWCHLWAHEFEATRLHLDIAAKLNPNDADLAMDRGTTLMYLGEPEAAVEVMEAAMRLNPFHTDSYLRDMAEAYFVARRHDAMLKIAEQISEPSPKFMAWKAAAYAYLGQSSDAARLAQAFVSNMKKIWQGDPDAGPPEYLAWLLLLCPFKRQQDIDHLVEGLKLAGLDVASANKPVPA